VSLEATTSSEILVGLGGLEPPTSPLSGVRSNHLSYRPNYRSILRHLFDVAIYHANLCSILTPENVTAGPAKTLLLSSR
jgi:hypothetical protein